MPRFSLLRFEIVKRDLEAAIYELSEERSDEMAIINGYRPGAIKAAIERAKSEAQGDMASAMDQLFAAQTAHAALPAAIREVATAIAKEAADGLQELAEFTNGGPQLDGEETPKTPVPAGTGIMTSTGIVEPAGETAASVTDKIIEPAK